MKRRLTRLGLVGLALVGLLAVGASPALAKKKKQKTRTVTQTAVVNQCVSTSSPIRDATAPGGLAVGVASIPVTIPPFRGAAQPGAVTAFTSVDVRIAHTFAGDLTIFLISPGGAFVPLAAERGAAGNGYGTGATSCSGTPVLFSDTATIPISTPGNVGDAPIAGTFRPEQPLSGLVGGPAGGTWRLLVYDSDANDTGALHGFSLNFAYSYQVLVKVKKKKKKKK